RRDPITDPLARFAGQAYNAYDVGLNAKQILWASGKVTGGVALARADRDLAGTEDEITRRDLALKIIDAFYSVILNRKNLTTLEKERKVNEELVETSQRYFKVGRSQLVDVYQVKTQVAVLKLKIEQA